VEEISTSRMDVDGAVRPPEQDSQMGDLEAAPCGPTFQCDGDETESGSDGGSDGGSENGGPVVESDSEDEFESDEESVNGKDGSRANQGTLDFELKAAEAGSVLHHIQSFEE